MTGNLLPEAASGLQHLSREQLDDNLSSLMSHDPTQDYSHKDLAKIIGSLAHNLLAQARLSEASISRLEQKAAALKLRAEEAQRDLALAQSQLDQLETETLCQRRTTDEKDPELQEEVERLQKALTDLHVDTAHQEQQQKDAREELNEQLHQTETLLMRTEPELQNLRSLSPSHFSSVVFSSLPSTTLFSSLEVTAATDTLCSTLTSCLDDICPLSSKPARATPPNPWLSDVLREHRSKLRAAERKWRKSKDPSDLSMYQSLLSSFSVQVHTTKSSYFHNKINNAPETRNLFKTFNSLLCPPTPPPTTSITADDFATFFTDKTTTISSQFSAPHIQELTPTTSTANNPLFSFCPLSKAEVSKLLLSSHPTICPLDPIPSHLLQATSPTLLPALTHIIIISLLRGTFSTAFKQARNSSLDANQSGFRSGHSTETALLSVTEALRIAKADSRSSVLILLDLSAAFGTAGPSGWPGEERYPKHIIWSLGFLRNHCRISGCLADISEWMKEHHLLLNLAKTELLVFPATPTLQHDFTIHLGPVISRLDYCNALLAGLPSCTIKPLQMIQNAAARLVFNEPKKAHVTPLFITLHWLPNTNMPICCKVQREMHTTEFPLTSKLVPLSQKPSFQKGGESPLPKTSPASIPELPTAARGWEPFKGTLSFSHGVAPKELDKLARNIPMFTPNPAGGHDVHAYVKDIDFHLQENSQTEPHNQITANPLSTTEPDIPSPSDDITQPSQLTVELPEPANSQHHTSSQDSNIPESTVLVVCLPDEPHETSPDCLPINTQCFFFPGIASFPCGYSASVDLAVPLVDCSFSDGSFHPPVAFSVLLGLKTATNHANAWFDHPRQTTRSQRSGQTIPELCTLINEQETLIPANTKGVANCMAMDVRVPKAYHLGWLVSYDFQVMPVVKEQSLAIPPARLTTLLHPQLHHNTEDVKTEKLCPGFETQVQQILRDADALQEDADRHKLRQVLYKYKDSFAKDSLDCGLTDLHVVRVPTHPKAPPTFVKQYKIPLESYEPVQDIITSMLEKGVIRPCNSTYSAPIWPVLKPNGKWRPTIDYRKLNQQVPLSRWPMTQLEQEIPRIRGATIFSTLDVASGFWTIPVHPDDQHKLAFRFDNRQYTFTRCPFGYANSPAEFNIFLNKACPDARVRGNLVFVDDIHLQCIQ
ncbi:Pro-Pol polyprotein [Labeo rohita]|uniref:ribonuclease H n=1 Tax=Labeo rohita TaxID=84645 RepID=A0ABQ8LZ05_LABRO|nr:Pro-Pol polyprotein [Labeo rohita]